MLRDCAIDVKPVQLSEEVCRGLSSADGVPSSFSSNGWNGAKRLNGWNDWNGAFRCELCAGYDRVIQMLSRLSESQSSGLMKNTITGHDDGLPLTFHPLLLTPKKLLSDPGHADKLLSNFILYPFAFIL
jgi:hypothetical protein